MFSSWGIIILALCPHNCHVWHSTCSETSHMKSYILFLYVAVYHMFMFLRWNQSWNWVWNSVMPFFGHTNEKKLFLLTSYVFFSLVCSVYVSVCLRLSICTSVCLSMRLSFHLWQLYIHMPQCKYGLEWFFCFSKSSRRAFDQCSITHKFSPVFKCALHPYLDTIQIQLWFVFGVYNPVWNSVWWLISLDLCCIHAALFIYSANLRNS